MQIQSQSFGNTRVHVAYNSQPPLMLGHAMLGKPSGAVPSAVSYHCHKEYLCRATSCLWFVNTSILNKTAGTGSKAGSQRLRWPV